MEEHLPDVGVNGSKICLHSENVYKVVRNVVEYGIPNSFHKMYLRNIEDAIKRIFQ